MSKALRKAPSLAFVLFVLGTFAVPAFAQAQSYTLTVQTDMPSYTGVAHIMISGTVSPVPSGSTAVIVTVLNPAKATVDFQNDPVDPATGAYSGLTVAGGPILCGGSPCWIAGQYVINATWGGGGFTATKTTTFMYSPSSAPTTTTTSVSCNPASFAAGATSQCTASVSGASGTISGETMTFSQAAAGGIMPPTSGNVTLPSPATCTLSGTSCSVTVTGSSPGPVTIHASYPGDANDAASSGTASVTVTPATTTTSVSCSPASLAAGATSSCTASVSGAAGTISGETMSFSQTGGAGAVTLPSPATCTLSGTSCKITVTGGTPGPVTIQGSYGGDTNNARSFGSAVINVTQITTTTTSSSTTSTTSTTTQTTSSTSSTTTTSSSTTSASKGGSGYLTYVIIAAVVVILAVVGLVLWRRRVASSYGGQPATK